MSPRNVIPPLQPLVELGPGRSRSKFCANGYTSTVLQGVSCCDLDIGVWINLDLYLVAILASMTIGSGNRVGLGCCWVELLAINYSFVPFVG